MNGQPSTSVKLADALLGVKLPADTEICKIELRYVPHTFYIGLAVSGSALLFFLFWYMIFRKNRFKIKMTVFVKLFVFSKDFDLSLCNFV